MDSVRKHQAAEGHRLALSAYAAPANLPDVLPGPRGDPGPCGEHEDLCIREKASSVLDYVPRRGKFMEVIRGCVRGQTGGGFASSFPASAELASPLISTGVLRDESRMAQQKMLTSVAAVLDDQQREMLRKAVRISFSDDDRDQHRILRIRVVWTSPAVGCCEFFGALLKDYGFDAEQCRDATIAGLRRLCAKRVRGSAEDGLRHPPQAELDQPLWDEVRQKIFCGATDGAAVALKGVSLMAAETCPNLRYQFRDRPHTTRTVQKMAFELCPESKEVRCRLITGKHSFARRAKNSRRFREIWLRKQAEEPNALWAVCQDLGFAEQRYDSRSKPMSVFLLKLGPALEVLKEMANDPRREHRDDAAWARELLQYLSGPSGFLRMVLFAIDTDFAVAVHKLVRLQDKEEPDVSIAASEVQHCVDTCRVLFEHGRVFDKTPNGTYTNSLLQGFRGVSRGVLLANGDRVDFGWPDVRSDLLKDAVLHAKKLYKAASLFFAYNFPHHSWRTRFQAFSSCTGVVEIADHVKRGHIRELAKKEGVDEIRAWEQFFEALPHVRRLYKLCGDIRGAWAAYLDAFCRARRPSQSWRPTADCIVPLVLTYLGVMDGSSDVERSFSQLSLAECRRAQGHHKEQFLQDTLKVRLHAPGEFREALLTNPEWSRAVGRFLDAAQRKYAELFGLRRLASRSTQPIALEDKRMLFSLRRPRWQRLCAKARASKKQQRVRREMWEEDVERLAKEVAEPGCKPPPSFLDHIHISARECNSLLSKAVEVMHLKGVAYEFYQREQEAVGALTAPPPPVQARSLLDARPRKQLRIGSGLAARARTSSAGSASAREARRRKISSAAVVQRSVGSESARAAAASASSAVVACGAESVLSRVSKPRASTLAVCPPAPPQWAGVHLPADLKVWFSPKAATKHTRTALYFSKQGILTSKEGESTHRIVGKGDLRASEGGRVLSLSAMLGELRSAVA